jgi:hypothetical protein
MTTLARRLPRGNISSWIALVLLLIFLGLAALVYFRDPSFGDAARLQELKDAPLPEPASTATDWPQWRGPNRDGVWPGKGLLTAWPEDLLTRHKLWEAKAGDGFSALAVADGRAVTMLQDGDSEAVVCWDAASGKEQWRFRYVAKYVSGMGSGPRSTPTIDCDLVYTVGATGMMHCLKLRPRDSQGELVWKKDLLKDFGAQNLQWGVSFSPLVVGESVYVNPGGPSGQSVVALDRKDGSVRWHALDDHGGYSSPVAANLAGKPQIVFFTAAGVVGLSPDNGSLYWRFAWKTEYEVNAATPIVVGDYVFLTSGYGRGCALLKIEADGSGQRASLVYRNRNMRCQFSSPVRHKNHIYGFDESILKCLDFRTGEMCWEQRGFEKGSLVIADGQLIILGERGRLALAEATPEGYREKSSVQFTNKQCWTMPVLAEGRLYLREPARIVCLDLRTSKQ